MSDAGTNFMSKKVKKHSPRDSAYITHVCLYAYIHACIQASIHTHLPTYTYIYRHKTYMHACTATYINTDSCMCVSIYAYIYTYKYISIYSFLFHYICTCIDMLQLCCLSVLVLVHLFEVYSIFTSISLYSGLHISDGW